MSHTQEEDDYCFGFAFNDSRFSDRVLNIEIFTDDSLASRKSNGLSFSDSSEASASNSINDEENVSRDQRREANPTKINDVSSRSEEDSRITKSMKFHVSSLILAAKSPFFHKVMMLFTNGMMESEQKCFTIKVHDSEEVAFMELLNYMYNGTLSAETAPDLLHMLKVADKFQVVSCMRLCKSLLTDLPLSQESALLCLDLASLSHADVVQPLIDSARQFFAANYEVLDKNLDKIMELPLEAVEVIMSNSDLQVRDEDAVFDFALEWTTSHYPKLEDQQMILSKQLGQYIRFPYMSPAKLREVLSCNKFDNDYAHNVVVEALLFKANTSHHHRYTTKVPTAINESTFRNHHRPFVQRRYNSRPIKLVKLEFPWPELAIYLDVMHKELMSLQPSRYICFQKFDWDGEPFSLCVGCEKERHSYLYVGLKMNTMKPVPFDIDYVVSARSQNAKDFAVLKKGSGKFTGDDIVMLHRCRWGGLMQERRLAFIDGMLYLKVDLRIKL